MKKDLLIKTFLIFCLGIMSNKVAAQTQDGVIDDPGDIAIVSFFGRDLKSMLF